MKTSQISVFLLAFIAVAKCQTWPTEPTPSPDFECPNREDGYYPHPTDCDHYYYCTNGLAWLMKCADPLLFNPKTKQCDWAWEVQCPSGGVTENPELKGASIIGPDPDYKCDPEVDGAFPHETDCDKFYDCWKGNASLGVCTENMLFDLTYSGCNWPQYTECQDRSRPTGLPVPSTTTSTTRRPGVTDGPEFQCPSPDGLFADPADCSSYYQCSGSTAYHQACSFSLYFREDLTVCDYPANVDCGTRPIPTKSNGEH